MTSAQGSFFITGGTLRHDAPSYVERRADRDLLEGLLKNEFCYVLTSRQMGKSSLMVRTAIKLREHGTHIIAMDLTAVGQNLTPEQWYDGLLMRMGRQLRLEAELEEFWRANERLGPCQRLFAALRDVVMARRPGPLAIFVDEIDTVRSLPFSIDEFFAAIRECYNRRVEDAEFGRLTFCLLGVATPSDLIRDTRTTPFNIGRRIELHDFTEAEAAPLALGFKDLPAARRLAANGHAPANGRVGKVLRRILYWTGGHPYLTQRLCHAIAEDSRAEDDTRVDEVCEELFLSHRAREIDDNLLFVRERLLRSEVDVVSLLELYGKVRGGKRVADDETSPLVSVLRLSGIVTSEAGFLRSRNRIYAKVFDAEWIRAHMPDAELRRQRAAFYRGVIRTTGIAAVVIAALAITMVVAVNQARKARLALAESHFSRARALRVSGLAGQRFESLDALGEARQDHTNAATLRDEALACLALTDIRDAIVGSPWPKSAGVTEWGPDLTVVAVAEPDGTITLRDPRNRQVRATLPAIGVPAERIEFGGPGSVLLAAYGGSAADKVVLWNWKEARRLFTTARGVSGEAVDFTADGRWLAVGGADGRVVVVSLPQGKVVCEIEMKLDTGVERVPRSVRLHPSGDLVAACSLDDQYVELWALGVTQRVARLYHTDVVRDLAWHPQGRLLAAACGDSRVYLWETNDFPEATMEKAKTLAGHEGRVTSIAFSHQGTLLASVGSDETVRLWIPATGRQVVGTTAGEGFDRLRFSTDDRHLIASDRASARGRIWAVAGSELLPLEARGGRGSKIRAIDFSPDSRWFLAADGRQVTLWQADTGWESGTVRLANAHAVRFAGDNRHLIASSDDGLFRWPLVWRGGDHAPCLDPQPAQRLHRTTAESNSPPRVKWIGLTNTASRSASLDELGTMTVSLDRRQAAVIHKYRVLMVPLEDHDLPRELSTSFLGAYFPQLALHPTGQWLAGKAVDSNALQLWKMPPSETGPAATVPSGDCFAFSSDGQWFATCWAGKFEFYHVGAWQKPVFTIPRAHASDQHAPVAFSRDGRLVALAASRYVIQLFQFPESGKGTPSLIATLESPDRLPLALLTFRPDGRQLAVTDGQLIQLWNLAQLREGLAALNLHGNWPEYPPN